MHRFIIASVVVVVALGALMYSAVKSSARDVVTVEKLVDSGAVRKRIRLGARVTEDPISYSTSPKFMLRFGVRDIVSPDKSLWVEYHDAMPDTLKAGRDVILEGDFDGKEFLATNLQTQCPSKYEVPGPGSSAVKTADDSGIVGGVTAK